jgi:hypothetical protein
MPVSRATGAIGRPVIRRATSRRFPLGVRGLFLWPTPTWEQATPTLTPVLRSALLPQGCRLLARGGEGICGSLSSPGNARISSRSFGGRRLNHLVSAGRQRWHSCPGIDVRLRSGTCRRYPTHLDVLVGRSVVNQGTSPVLDRRRSHQSCGGPVKRRIDADGDRAGKDEDVAGWAPSCAGERRGLGRVTRRPQELI